MVDIAIRQVNIQRQHRKVVQGQSVLIMAEVVSVGIHEQLFDPMYIPTINIFKPDGTVDIVDHPMVQMSTGVYSYTYNTDDTKPEGTYTVMVMAIDDTNMAVLPETMAFVIKGAAPISSFDYLIIKDQTATVWYWYIGGDNTLVSDVAVPHIIGKQAVQYPINPVPSWLLIVNPNGDTRYIYPDISGEATVIDTQPLVGTGNVGSPALKGVNGSTFLIDVNISDEIILQTLV